MGYAIVASCWRIFPLDLIEKFLVDRDSEKQVFKKKESQADARGLCEAGLHYGFVGVGVEADDGIFKFDFRLEYQ